MSKRSIDQALADLAEAHTALGVAQQETSYARGRETDCTNRVNKLQAEVDSLMAAIKSASPRGTDWTRKNSIGETS